MHNNRVRLLEVDLQVGKLLHLCLQELWQPEAQHFSHVDGEFSNFRIFSYTFLEDSLTLNPDIATLLFPAQLATDGLHQAICGSGWLNMQKMKL